MNKIYLLILLTTTILYSNPHNTNVLIQRGVDPQILNLSVTTFRQDIGYKMQVHLEEKYGQEFKNQDFNILYDPFASYGIDIRLETPKQNDSNIDRSKLETLLDETMALQSYLQSRALYDANSFKIISSDINDTIISFDFNNKAIPREINHYKKLKGYVYISNNILKKIVVKNKDRFVYRGVEVHKYEKILKFSNLSLNGGYLLNGLEVIITGEKDKEDYFLDIKTDSISYWDKSKKNIPDNAGMIKTDFAQAEDYETIYVELNRLFPLLGQAARKEGYDLPKPFGITLINMFQSTTMHMTSFELDGLDVDLNEIIGGDSKYENMTFAPLLRTDMWLLPFLNVGLILGSTLTKTDITLHSPNGLTIQRPSGTDIELIKPNSQITLEGLNTKSLLYGVGATMAGGVGNYFSTIDFQYVVSYTDEADVSLEMMVITPLIGYNFTDYGSRVFIGGQYQDLQEELTFSIQDTSGETLSGKVGLTSSKWAGVLGVDHSFTRHWSGNILVSQGEDITNFVVSAAYRW